MATGAINMPFDMNFKSFTQLTYAPSRAEYVNGGFNFVGCHVTLNAKFKAIASASNSPQVATISKVPRIEIALSCIDITNGISNAIEKSVPCGINTNGAIYVKEIETDHIYAISGTYIADN